MKNLKNKTWVWYVGIFLLVLLLVNIFTSSAFFSTQSAEIPYSEFLSLLEAGKVADVEIGTSYITFDVIAEEGQKPAKKITQRLYEDQQWLYTPPLPFNLL